MTEKELDDSLIVKEQNNDSTLNVSVFENYYLKEKQRSKFARFRNSCHVTMSQKQNQNHSQLENIFIIHKENQKNLKDNIKKRQLQNNNGKINEKNDNFNNKNKKSRFQSNYQKQSEQKGQQQYQQRYDAQQNLQFVQNPNSHLPKFQKSMILLNILNITQEKILNSKSNFFHKDLQFLKQGNQFASKIKQQIQYKNKCETQSSPKFNKDDNLVNFTEKKEKRQKLQKTSINLGNPRLQIPIEQDQKSKNLISSWNALQKLDITYKTKQQQLLKQNYELCTKIKQLQNKLKDLSMKNQYGDNIRMSYSSQNKAELKYQQVQKRIKKLKEQKEKLRAILQSLQMKKNDKEKDKKILNEKNQDKQKEGIYLIQNLKNLSTLIYSKFKGQEAKNLMQNYFRKIVNLNGLQYQFQLSSILT